MLDLKTIKTKALLREATEAYSGNAKLFSLEEK